MVKPSRRVPMVERLVGSYLVSGVRAVFFAWRERPIGIAVASIHGLSCGCASARSLRQECRGLTFHLAQKYRGRSTSCPGWSGGESLRRLTEIPEVES